MGAGHGSHHVLHHLEAAGPSAPRNGWLEAQLGGTSLWGCVFILQDAADRPKKSFLHGGVSPLEK